MTGRSARFLSRRDVDFCLYEWLDVTALTGRERFAAHDRDTFDAVLDLSETIAADHFATHYQRSDVAEPYIAADGSVELIPGIGQALDTYTNAGLQASRFDEHFGGMQLPLAVHQAASMFFQAANIGTFSYPSLAAGNAALVITHGTTEQAERFARPIVEGRWHGTMCLSEPQAGSSLGDVSTKAVQQDDGTYRLFGTKMWISAGDHELGENIVHLVLARVEGAPSGVKGLSLFIVPKHLVLDDGSIGERNDVTLVGLNHKMGYRATTNTLLNFGEGNANPGGAPGAVGHLVGDEGHGLSYMFHMMNEARTSVGAGATALGYAGYLHALEYARTRIQGRPVGVKDPDAEAVVLTSHPDVRRMLLAQKSYVEGGLGLVLYCAKLVDEESTAPLAKDRDAARVLLDVLTPIAKSWPAQWCLKANDLAIQVHGGYGYTRDFIVEQLYRDNRLNSIHEGTHGIQALDLLGRKLVVDNGAGLKALDAAIRVTVRHARVRKDLRNYADLLEVALDRLVDVTEAVWAPGDASIALANASLHLETAGHIVVAWIWLEQLVASHGQIDAFYEGKRAAAQYFYRFELPTIYPLLSVLEGLDRTTLDLDPSVL